MELCEDIVHLANIIGPGNLAIADSSAADADTGIHFRVFGMRIGCRIVLK